MITAKAGEKVIKYATALLMGNEIGDMIKSDTAIVPYTPITVEKIIEKQSQMPLIQTIGVIFAILVLVIAAILYIIKVVLEKRSPRVSEA